MYVCVCACKRERDCRCVCVCVCVFCLTGISGPSLAVVPEGNSPGSQITVIHSTLTHSSCQISSPSLSHTHTHTHTQPHAGTHTHTRTHTNTPTHTDLLARHSQAATKLKGPY